MLKLRIVTAAILLGVLLVTLLVPSPWPLMILLSVIAGCALWEWLRLSAKPGMSFIALPAGLVLSILLIVLSGQLVATSPNVNITAGLAWFNQTGMLAVSVLWVIGGGTAVYRAHTHDRRHPLLLSFFGGVAVVALWLALVQLFLHHGAWLLVSMMALIWFADSVAYFVGRAIGQHKLAPRISPGKTWEGAIGGVMGAVAWMALSALWGHSFAAVLVERWGVTLMVLISILLAALSIMGDLFESLLKRRAGVKDSSQLLPGHGGVYDRIDALFPVAPLALLLAGVA